MNRTEPLATDEDILRHLSYIRNKKQEYVVCLSLSSAGHVIKRRTVTIGLLDMALVHPREIFAGPLKDHAAAVIVAHNHPSGDPYPSQKDIEATQQLVAAGILLGVHLRDHVIITTQEYYSFRQAGLI
jgi:DNA repair protein RadC